MPAEAVGPRERHDGEKREVLRREAPSKRGAFTNVARQLHEQADRGRQLQRLQELLSRRERRRARVGLFDCLICFAYKACCRQYKSCTHRSYHEQSR